MFNWLPFFKSLLNVFIHIFSVYLDPFTKIRVFVIFSSYRKLTPNIPSSIYYGVKCQKSLKKRDLILKEVNKDFKVF